jgi:hypothetical protein
LLNSFSHLNFNSLLGKTQPQQFSNQWLQPIEFYFSFFCNRNKIYLDFFAKNKFTEACLKQAFRKFLLLRSFMPLKQLAMSIDNKFVVNKRYLKSLFASPSGSLMQSNHISTKVVKVQSNLFTGDFLWKYRDQIYQPIYEEIIEVSQH